LLNNFNIIGLQINSEIVAGKKKIKIVSLKKGIYPQTKKADIMLKILVIIKIKTYSEIDFLFFLRT
jgi:hypothetical protein